MAIRARAFGVILVVGKRNCFLAKKCFLNSQTAWLLSTCDH
jgi:hypothetical protein